MKKDKKKEEFNKPAERHNDPKGRLEHFLKQRGGKIKENLKAREEWFKKRHGGKKAPKGPEQR